MTIEKTSKFIKYLAAVCCIWLCAGLHAYGQRPTTGATRNTGGGGGGFGTGGGGGRAIGAGGGTSSRTYYNNGMVGEAMISSDPETRRLIVITDDETSEYVSQVITNLDQPKPQVLIKVVFLEVVHGKARDIGVDGGTAQKVNNSTVLASNLFSSIAQGIAGPNQGGTYQITGNDYQVTLHAIETADKTEVLSRPSILARNNQLAVITVGQEVPLITNTRFDTVGNQINTVTYQDVGIILRVTPFITSDGMVEMIVSPEISHLSAQTVAISTGSNPVSAPIIDKRSADTVVVTPNGQTVVIGGLMETSKTLNDSKIPFLGDLPVLGALFRRRITSEVKTELIIFLTPHIVMQPSQLAAVSAAERKNAQLQPKAFTEDELNRFLNDLPNKGQTHSGKISTKSSITP